VPTHCSGSGGSGCDGGGGGDVKMSPDTILPPPPIQKNFTVTAAVCGDLYTVIVRNHVSPSCASFFIYLYK